MASISDAIELWLLWAFWPAIVRGTLIRSRSIQEITSSSKGVVATLCVLTMSLVIATFPGEWLHGLPNMRLMPRMDRFGNWSRASLHELLIAGEVDLAAQKAKKSMV